MNVSGIRRNIKNIAHNYTDAQVISFKQLLFSSVLMSFVIR